MGGIEIIKDKEDDQSSPKIEAKEDQIAESHKKEKEIKKLEIESIKDKADDQSSLKVEEKEDDICSEVENAEDEITTKEDQIAEVHKKEKEIEKVGIEIVKDRKDDQSSSKLEEKENDIFSENAKDKITTQKDQIAETHKKEKETEKVEIDIVKDKEDDQSSPKVEENKDDICSDVENIEDKIMNEGYQIAEVNKKEKEIEKIEIESIKDKEDDQSSPKVEEKDDDICSEVENAKDEITT